MDYRRFRELVEGGEKSTVDFKLRCHAFARRTVGRAQSELANAELAKDICAMANNGYTASYILVGVSDDGHTFETVDNPSLTDDNLQAFCKTAVYPPPKVQIHRECWDDGRPEHVGKGFVIIQVGPQARQAFRLQRDFVDYEHRYVYRRNDVWIRRNATSDLATPEEIARLVKGKAPEGVQKPASNIEYEKLPASKRPEAVWHDLVAYINDAGGVIDHGRFMLRIGGVRFVWRVAYADECTTDFSAWDTISRYWRYEHVVLLLVRGSVAKRAFPKRLEVHYPDTWGYYTRFDAREIWPVPDWRFDHSRPAPLRGWLPANSDRPTVSAFTVRRVRDTHALRTSLANIVASIEGDGKLFEHLQDARQGLNSDLRCWLKRGWLVPAQGYHLANGPWSRELADDEMLDPRSPTGVLKRVRVSELEDTARRVLDLSAGRRARTD